MINPEELTPGTLVCLDARSGIYARYRRVMPWFEVTGSRATILPASQAYVWVTGLELDDRGRQLATVGWCFLRRDGITLVAAPRAARCVTP